MYHIVVEALLAQPGQHFISDYLEKRELLPGFRAGMKQVALDEQRHIGFGVKLLHDLAQEDPGVPEAVADLLRRATPYSLAVFIPPGWDRSYTECFGFTLEEIYTEGARSFEAKMRSAGLPLDSLPGPPVFPLELDARGRAEYGLAMLRAGFLGPGQRRAAARPGVDGAAVRTRWRAPSTTAPRPPARSPCSGSSPTPSRGTCASTTASTAAAAGRAEHVDVEVRCRYEDWVDIVAGRLDPRRALVTGRLRPHGSPRALWAARGLF